MAEKRKRRGHNDGSVYRRKDGRWAADITLGYEQGKRKRKTFYGATQAEVIEKLDKAKVDHRAGRSIPTGRQTVGEFLDRWLAECVKPSVRPKTYQSYEEQVRLHIKPGIGHMQLARVSGQHVQSFINSLLNKKTANTKATPKNLSTRTVAYSRTILRMALTQAEEWHLIPHNPAATRIRLPKTETRKVDPLTIDESRSLIEAIEGNRLRAFFLILFCLGLRRGEALGLRWQDIDLDARKLNVRGTLQRIDKVLVLGQPKTEKSQRELTIPVPVVTALREHRARQLTERMAAGPVWQDTGFVFTTATGSPIDPRNAKRTFDALLKDASLPHYRLHDLRHLYASHLLAQGVDLKIVSDILGHTNIGITANIYTHVSQTVIRDAMDKITAVVGAN